MAEHDYFVTWEMYLTLDRRKLKKMERKHMQYLREPLLRILKSRKQAAHV